MTEPVTCHVAAEITAEVIDPTTVYLAIATASTTAASSETMSVTVDGTLVELVERQRPHGGRLHVVPEAPRGEMVIHYEATAATNTTEQAAPTDDERLLYLCPSRYCQSDELTPSARGQFGHLEGIELVDAVSAWVFNEIEYLLGSSRPTDGAVSTMLARRGVCRDFAHLTVALLRANDLPARLVSVYAPGLDPMDFHAVAEVCIEDRWILVDSTRLAPRPSMVRVATGTDAAHTAFLTTIGGAIELKGMWVQAVADGDLPLDDHTQPLSLT